MKIWALTLSLSCSSLLAWGDKSIHPSALDGHLLWGDCKLTTLPNHRDAKWPVVCANLNSSADLLINLTDSAENVFGLFASAYTGIHVLPWMSWHLSARREKLHPLQPTEFQLLDLSEIERSFVQIGNPALHHVRVLIGRAPLPYGLDFDVLPPIFRSHIKDRQYWKFPIYSASISYDNLLDTIAEIGIGSDKVANQTRSTLQIKNYTKGSDTADPEQTYSARVSHDISALGGTRVMIFHLRSMKTDTRYGAAIINETRRDSATSIEWQRRFLRGDANEKMQQLFRLVYMGPFERGQRFTFEYEDNRTLYWMLNFGHEYEVFDHGSLRLNLGYYRREEGRRLSHFFVNTGLEVKL